MKKTQMTVVPPEFVECDSGFGYWLAGLIDGEGSFGIIGVKSRHKRGYQRHNYTCRVSVSLRDDDRQILEYIRAMTGCGTICDKQRRDANPQSDWSVQNKAECLRMVRILDSYPLRSKKANDYMIWRQAVLLWQTVVSGKRFDWSSMIDLKASLEKGKRYDGARSGQPLTVATYHEAIKHSGVTFEETEEKCSGGSCGV